MPGATRRVGVVQVGADELAYDDINATSDHCVVLIHGSGGNRATWWPVLPRLVAEGWRVINVDVRGSGRSTDRAEQLGPRQVAADLEAIREDAAVDRWHVVGHSMGGWHALRYAAEHPEATTATTCLSSIGGVMTAAAIEWFAEFARMAASWSAAADAFSSASLGQGWCSDHPGEAYLYQVLRDLNPPPVRGVPGERMAEIALTDAELATLSAMDVRFSTGEHDPYAPPAVVESCAARLSARFAMLPGAGHTAFWEAPAALVL